MRFDLYKIVITLFMLTLGIFYFIDQNIISESNKETFAAEINTEQGKEVVTIQDGFQEKYFGYGDALEVLSLDRRLKVTKIGNGDGRLNIIALELQIEGDISQANSMILSLEKKDNFKGISKLTIEKGKEENSLITMDLNFENSLK